MNTALQVQDVKVFVPTKDYKLSLDFYQKLGCTVNWDSGELAEMQLGEVRFFLQKYYHKGWAHNFMLYINVSDVQAWYRHLHKLIAEGAYAEAKIKAPAQQEHGDIVCYVWDPCGVLLHFAEAQS